MLAGVYGPVFSFTRSQEFDFLVEGQEEISFLVIAGFDDFVLAGKLEWILFNPLVTFGSIQHSSKVCISRAAVPVAMFNPGAVRAAAGGAEPMGAISL